MDRNPNSPINPQVYPLIPRHGQNSPQGQGEFGPVVNQPQAFPGTTIPNCPPGLECLATIDQLIVKQKVDALSSTNRYVVRNSLGQDMFWAIEESDCLPRFLIGKSRPLNLRILDLHDNEVMNFYRPYGGCCWHSIEITAAGSVIGRVEMERKLWRPGFQIMNQAGDTVLRMELPAMFGNDFKIVTVGDGNEIGKISKKWGGLAREIFTDADNFGISFPADLEINIKAVLLGACLLMDLMFYEN